MQGVPTRAKKRGRHPDSTVSHVGHSGPASSLCGVATDVIGVILSFQSTWGERLQLQLVNQKWYTAVTSLLEDELTSQIDSSGTWKPRPAHQGLETHLIICHLAKMSEVLRDSIHKIDLYLWRYEKIEIFQRLFEVELRGLQCLSFARCRQMQDARIKELAGIPSLTSLDLERCPISDAALEELATHVPGLKSLNLTNCEHFRDRSFKGLSPD